MKKTEQCAKEEVLVPAVSAGGLEEIRITKIDEQQFVLSVKLYSKRDRIFLSTRRNPHQPRIFKRVDVAIRIGSQLFGAKRFLVVL